MDVALKSIKKGGLLLLVALGLLRGKGDLKVSIEYPSELRGTFAVRAVSWHTP